MPMDIVITYVNGLDPVWQKQYKETTNAPIWVERFRDWGTLKYIFRGIENCMPFINNVFLVVSTLSQVPNYINDKKVKVITHDMFIPKEYLPTFNCNTIEAYLYRIPGLSEEFIYFNDDMFPMKKMSPKNFFEDGIPNYKVFEYDVKPSDDMFRKLSRVSDNMAKKACGIKENNKYLRPQHTCAPMLRSKSEEAYNICEKEIRASITTIRSDANMNQYFYTDYLYYSGIYGDKKIPYKYFSFSKNAPKEIYDFINNPTEPIMCLNDGKLSLGTFRNFKRGIIKHFEKYFPNRSKFEK